MEVDTLLPAELLRVLADRLRQTPSGMTSPTSMVLLRHWRPEEGHYPVTGELVDRPAEPAHPLGQDGHEPAHDSRPHLGVKLLLEIHGARDVGEEDGDLLALSLGGRSLGGDRRSRIQRLPALPAEPFSRLVRRATGAAHGSDRERRSAAGTELPPLPVGGAARRAGGSTRHPGARPLAATAA